jgi:CheY-like chemotaxis protein
LKIVVNKWPILIIDNDSDDWEFLQEAWNGLNYDNKLIFFSSAEEALEFLENNAVVPFLILCDVNLPKMDGFLLKEEILNSHLRYKSIPFVFWSSIVSTEQIKRAYDLGVNGFFLKENSITEIKNTLIDIVKYWLRCIVPE